MTSSLEEIKELINVLNDYRDAYYNKSKPKVTDIEYDKLYDKLEKLEKQTGIIMSNSPTQTVGYPVKSALKKVKHSHLMLSLAKTKDVNEFAKYCGNHDSIFSLKMDGLTCLLTYKNGKLVQAETRGDGIIGEDITENALTFENIPLTIPIKNQLEVEGEAIITYSDFKKINSLLPISEQYSNPRNLASGSVRQLDSSVTAKRHVKFIVWKVPYLTEIIENRDINNFADRLDYMETLGFDVVPYFKIRQPELFDKYIDSLKTWAKGCNYPYDGFVHTYVDIKYGESLGNTGHHPKHSFVLKENDEEYETTLKEIVWQCGKTGVISPVAVFNDVDLDGAITNRASVHNVSILTKLELIPGDTITVYRANQVIPQIRRNISAENRPPVYINIPSTCPVCGGMTEIKRDNDSDILICTNPNCRGKLLGKLKHFCSKDAMDIQGLSEQTLDKLISLNWINNIPDIYKCFEDSNHIAILQRMSGFGIRSVDNLKKSIQNSKHTTLDRFINALSIPNIGKEASKVIAKHFDYSFIKFGIACNTNFNWQRLSDFGETMEKSLKNYWSTNKKWVTELGSEMDFYNPNENKVTNNILSGKIFVVTGKVFKFKNRNELSKKIEDLGGKVTGSVSKNTDYLINNDVTSNSGKNKKAKELGVKIISEDEFTKMIGE